jgi:hypothetical protein
MRVAAAQLRGVGNVFTCDDQDPEASMRRGVDVGLVTACAGVLVASFLPWFGKFTAQPARMMAVNTTTAWNMFSEYWIIDPLDRKATFLRLRRRAYEVVPLKNGCIFVSEALPGFWLNTAWVFRDPLPDELECLDQILAAPAS